MAAHADLILANRAYLDHDSPPSADGRGAVLQGGLLAAVRPVIAPWEHGQGTTWIGAGRGPFDRDFTDPAGWEVVPTSRGDLRHRRLYFDDETWRGHYSAVANSFFWPLLHLVRLPLPALTEYYPSPHEPSKDEWGSYVAVNDAFARAAAEIRESRSCWVHDYQLALTPALLREHGYPGRIGFFLHTPFPDFRIARAFLDDHERDLVTQFVRGILGADLAGFQTRPDLERFVAAACELAGCEREGDDLIHEGRRVALSACPVGVDFDDVLTAARAGTLAADVRAAIDPALPLVVGLERADFTKGIPERLDAIAAAFEAGARFSYVGAAAPTRQGVPAYARLQRAIDERAALASAAADRAGGTFLQIRKSIPWDEVVALQREADVVFTSSLADGMNLVPLQTIAAQSLRPAGGRGTVVAGCDAGVASALEGFDDAGFTAVDPLDPAAMRETLTKAVEGNLPQIADRLIAAVRENDAQAWATRFITALEG